MTTATEERAGFTPEVFARFWAKPDPELVPNALTEDVVGHWPGRREPIRGRADYTRCIADLIRLIPDFHGEVVEHAGNGDLFFVRWVMRGTGAHGPFELGGIDRVRVRDGLVAENVIVFDTEEFRDRVGHDVPWRD